MLGAARYLLGVAELGLLIGFAWLGASTLRSWLLPRFEGAPAFLATTVLSLAILLFVAEALGSFGLFEPLPYLLCVAIVGLVLASSRGWRRSGGPPRGSFSYRRGGGARSATGPAGRGGRGVDTATVLAFAIAAIAVIHFAVEAKAKLSTGMTGFDSTWYHGPFAAGFFQSGDTWSLHFIAPQFLAWFYPASSEVAHAIGMLAFDRDILSPLLNLGWFLGCLIAAWCIGRPYGVAPWSLGLAAIALSVPALSDQAGEARNDIVGIFFLLAAVAILLAQRERSSTCRQVGTAFALGPTVVVGLSAGMAAGTKLNFLLPAAVLIIGMTAVSRGARWRALGAAVGGALLGGGYWYLRNLAHTGNPLPWVRHLGPITLPAPEQALGGREGHSVLGYLADGSVWSDWFLPGLHDGLTILWPVLLALALAGLLFSVTPLFRCAFCTHSEQKAHRNGGGVLVVAGLTGLAAALAWLIAPTSASGPDGMPRGFESGLRYLAPALVLGLALLPTAPTLRTRLASLTLTSSFVPDSGTKDEVSGSRWWGVGTAVAVVLVVVAGYPVQRHYLENRYADPSFTAPGLNAAFGWARGVTDARIATTSTRQYPLFGTDLSNDVAYVGEEQPHGGFTAPATCRRWRQLLNAGSYDYVVTTYDRLEPANPPYPPTAHWTEAPSATVVLRKPPTVIYKLRSSLDPSACR
jgi:hypothetical protein